MDTYPEFLGDPLALASGEAVDNARFAVVLFLDELGYVLQRALVLSAHLIAKLV